MEKTNTKKALSPVVEKGGIILTVSLATLLFSIFRRIDTFFQIGNLLASWAWPAVPVFLTMALVRLVFGGTVVLVVLPPVLGFKRLVNWLPVYLRIDQKGVLLGVLSFAVFCILATAISLSMGIFRGDLSMVFARPDLGPDPDVVGWAYFLLALVPGIWEELAFRGLIQSRLRKVFSAGASVLLSATFFGLFHFTNLLTQAPAQVIGGVVMAFFFGIAWGVMTVRSQSVIPAMLSHYLVDALGQVFLTVDAVDSHPALATGFFLLLTLTFSACNIVLARIMIKDQSPLATERQEQSSPISS